MTGKAAAYHNSLTATPPTSLTHTTASMPFPSRLLSGSGTTNDASGSLASERAPCHPADAPLSGAAAPGRGKRTTE